MIKAWASHVTQVGPTQECINRRMGKGIVGLSIYCNTAHQQQGSQRDTAIYTEQKTTDEWRQRVD